MGVSNPNGVNSNSPPETTPQEGLVVSNPNGVNSNIIMHL